MIRLVCLGCTNNPCKCELDERTEEIRAFYQTIKPYEFPQKKKGKCITCSKRRQRDILSGYGAACLLECHECYDVRWLGVFKRVAASEGFETQITP